MVSTSVEATSNSLKDESGLQKAIEDTQQRGIPLESETWAGQSGCTCSSPEVQEDGIHVSGGDAAVSLHTQRVLSCNTSHWCLSNNNMKREAHNSIAFLGNKVLAYASDSKSRNAAHVERYKGLLIPLCMS